MKKTFRGPFETPLRQLLRQAGYSEQRAKGTHEVGFVRRLTPAPYPRFHAYISEDERRATISLHLDQKWASYESGHAHGGDYEGPLVEREMARLASLFTPNKRSVAVDAPTETIVDTHQKNALPRLVREYTPKTDKKSTQPWWQRFLSHWLR